MGWKFTAWQSGSHLVSSGGPMTQLRTILTLVLGLLALPMGLLGQEQPQETWKLEGQYGWAVSLDTQIGIATNAMLSYGGAVLTADRIMVNITNYDAIAEGHVRLQQGERIWNSEHLHYNFQTHQIEAETFRTGQPPMFAAGAGLHGDLSNRVYFATNAVLTTDDIANPAIKVRARRIKIIPGKKIEAYDGVLYVGEVPLFYFPYYTRNLGPRANNFTFTPGYRSVYGPYILGSYTWNYQGELQPDQWMITNAVAHLDYRLRRGPGLGPDLNYHLGKWGDGTLKYYYTHDKDPNIDELGVPISEDRQRVWFSYESNPSTNLFLKGLVRYESDLAVVRDFFEREYRLDPQPNTFFDANRFWQNFSVDAYVQPRVNEFLQTVERLPDIRITGYRQQVGATPVYYESQSSAGYYRQLYAVNAGIYGPPPGLNYEAARADTFHQLLLPETFFGWLNVTPRVGGRFTYYTEASGPGATTEEQTRGVFNTGAEVTFKVSRLWPNQRSDFFEVDGLRHIIEPSANYVFVPSPTTPPSQLPQFDSELPSLRLLPIEYPDYNAIDSIDSQNVIRLGLRNKLQTKREDKVVNLLNWDLYTDWRLKPQANQSTFADLYSDLTFRPRSWLTLESLTRYDLNTGLWRMSYNTLTIRPNNIWSWSLGQYYLRDDFSPSPTALGEGNSVFTSTFYYRLNENWGLRLGQYFNARTGRLQEQAYTIYRDMRSWTAALSFVARDNQNGPHDYGVSFTFSLKAFPRFGGGSDAGGAYSLLGH
jgi:lipopolysaccharide assembly outer membrane protein LptD (OstA)